MCSSDLVACIANFTPVPRSGYLVGLPWAGEWEVLVDTDSPAWGGSGYAGYDVGGDVRVTTVRRGPDGATGTSSRSASPSRKRRT